MEPLENEETWQKDDLKVAEGRRKKRSVWEHCQNKVICHSMKRRQSRPPTEPSCIYGGCTAGRTMIWVNQCDLDIMGILNQRKVSTNQHMFFHLETIVANNSSQVQILFIDYIGSKIAILNGCYKKKKSTY